MSKVDYEKIARLEAELLGIHPVASGPTDIVVPDPNQDNKIKRITVKDDWGGAIDTCPECAGEVCLAGYCPRCGWNAEVGV